MLREIESLRAERDELLKVKKEQEKTRASIIALAQSWDGHEGVDYNTTTTENLIRLVKDAVDYDGFLLHRRPLLDTIP